MSKFNFNIDTDNDDIQFSKHSLNNINQRDFFISVDLGLPSGTIWGMYNLGVNPAKLDTAEDWHGGYFAWGETKSKDRFTWENYKYGNAKTSLTKYCTRKNCGFRNFKDGKVALELEDDAAYVNLGKCWSIPSACDMVELDENTTSEWVDNYNDIENLCGRTYTSKINGNHIFLPFTGYMECSNVVISDSWKDGRYWLLEMDVSEQGQAYAFGFNKNWERLIIDEARCNGLCIRGVIKNKF